jgi:hypothetical protein
MNSLAIKEQEVLDVGEMSLSEVAQAMNREWVHVRNNFERGAVHSVRVGLLLAEARRRVPRGGWQVWLGQNFDGDKSWAHRLMRVAEQYGPQILAGEMTWNDGVKLLRGISGPVSAGAPIATPEMLVKARSMRREGLTYREIGEQLGVSTACAHDWLTESQRKRRARRRAATAALKIQERERAIKRAVREASDVEGDVYSAIRIAAQKADRAVAALDPPKRAYYNAILTKLYEAEDESVRALGVSLSRPPKR